MPSIAGTQIHSQVFILIDGSIHPFTDIQMEWREWGADADAQDIIIDDIYPLCILDLLHRNQQTASILGYAQLGGMGDLL